MSDTSLKASFDVKSQKLFKYINQAYINKCMIFVTEIILDG